MRKRPERTEFAVWLKGRTPEALRLDVPLGFLERQPTLSEEAHDALLEQNRVRYCGTLADVLAFPAAGRRAVENAVPESPRDESPAPSLPAASPRAAPEPEPAIEPTVRPKPMPPIGERELGKGGSRHRYLQSLVKELAEQQGFRATIEAPLASGAGQVDVLLERENMRVAFEISVSTPVEQERANLRKCLAAGFDRVAVVLAKSRTTQGRYRSSLAEGLTDVERDRVSFLAPEDLPDHIAALAPVPAPSQSFIKGYRVKVSHTAVSPEDAKQRRDRVAKLVARSLREAT